MAAIVAALVPVGGPTASEAGLRMWIPPGWHEVERRLTKCVNPAERLTIAGPGGGMVHLQESLDPRRYVLRVPRRPAAFAPRGEPQWIGCCAPVKRRGWFVYFRDNGRGLYAYVYGTTFEAKWDAFAALNSLLVEQRR